MRTFEFHEYAADADGVTVTEARISTKQFEEKAQAKHYAGTLARGCNGPVDIAAATDAPWSSRYIATAMPSEHHRAGYRIERMR